jgi:hypothetical protein
MWIDLIGRGFDPGRTLRGKDFSECGRLPCRNQAQAAEAFDQKDGLTTSGAIVFPSGRPICPA